LARQPTAVCGSLSSMPTSAAIAGEMQQHWVMALARSLLLPAGSWQQQLQQQMSSRCRSTCSNSNEMVKLVAAFDSKNSRKICTPANRGVVFLQQHAACCCCCLMVSNVYVAHQLHAAVIIKAGLSAACHVRHIH
jgi:hypothetical protein